MIEDKEIQLMVGRLHHSNIDYTIESALSQCKKGVNNIGIKWEEIQSKSRKHKIIDARRLCCVHLRKKGWTYDMIASFVGYTNHATVYHHCRRSEELIKYDPEYLRKSLKFYGK
tara:strand:- start:451 stop:792 length:342 start_codon:yes stop_codon:yes gene_type:complete